VVVDNDWSAVLYENNGAGATASVVHSSVAVVAVGAGELAMRSAAPATRGIVDGIV
jgi:hypothetical protein